MCTIIFVIIRNNNYTVGIALACDLYRTRILRYLQSRHRAHNIDFCDHWKFVRSITIIIICKYYANIQLHDSSGFVATNLREILATKRIISCMNLPFFVDDWQILGRLSDVTMILLGMEGLYTLIVTKEGCLNFCEHFRLFQPYSCKSQFFNTFTEYCRKQFSSSFLDGLFRILTELSASAKTRLFTSLWYH